MNGHRAKEIRTILDGILERFLAEHVAMVDAPKKASLHTAQRNMYLRTKRLYVGLGPTARVGLRSALPYIARDVFDLVLKENINAAR